MIYAKVENHQDTPKMELSIFDKQNMDSKKILSICEIAFKLFQDEKERNGIIISNESYKMFSAGWMQGFYTDKNNNIIKEAHSLVYDISYDVDNDELDLAKEKLYRLDILLSEQK